MRNQIQQGSVRPHCFRWIIVSWVSVCIHLGLLLWTSSTVIRLYINRHTYTPTHLHFTLCLFSIRLTALSIILDVPRHPWHSWYLVSRQTAYSLSFSCFDYTRTAVYLVVPYEPVSQWTIWSPTIEGGYLFSYLSVSAHPTSALTMCLPYQHPSRSSSCWLQATYMS